MTEPTPATLLLAFALFMRCLPRNQWLSTSVITLGMILTMLAAERSLALSLLPGKEMGGGDRLLWGVILVFVFMALQELWQMLTHREPPPEHPIPGESEYLDWANREGRWTPPAAEATPAPDGAPAVPRADASAAGEPA